MHPKQRAAAKEFVRDRVTGCAHLLDIIGECVDRALCVVNHAAHIAQACLIHRTRSGFKPSKHRWRSTIDERRSIPLFSRIAEIDSNEKEEKDTIWRLPQKTEPSDWTFNGFKIDGRRSADTEYVHSPRKRVS